MSEMEPGGDKQRQEHSFAFVICKDREGALGKIVDTGCKKHTIDVFITRAHCIRF